MSATKTYERKRKNYATYLKSRDTDGKGLEALREAKKVVFGSRIKRARGFVGVHRQL